MPVYVYRCEACGSQLEKKQSFSDAPLTECERCHGRLHKVLQPTTIIYKGSGFYSTDHRSTSGGNGGHGGDGKSESSEPTKPASSSTTETGKVSAPAGES